jgi:hypothetical protein
MLARKMLFVAAAGMLAGATLVSGDASAQRGDRGGGRDLNDAYEDILVKNPRFIQPYGYDDPARYRVGAPREGYVDRQMAARGYYTPGSGYYPVPPRGRVYVRPYSDFDDED